MTATATPAPESSPEMSVAIEALKLVTLAGLKAERERHSEKWCRSRGIGKRRAYIGRALPANVIVPGAIKSPEFTTYLEAQRMAERWLSTVCAACGACPWAGR